MASVANGLLQAATRKAVLVVDEGALTMIPRLRGKSFQVASRWEKIQVGAQARVAACIEARTSNSRSMGLPLAYRQTLLLRPDA